MHAITIDDLALPVRRPETIAEAAAVVAECAAANQAVYPVGGGTTLDIGLPPSRPGIALDLSGLNQVVDYPARDMTITVQAGITIETLQQTLAAEGQWLPIDVPSPERATLGGAVALNISGPRRFGYGTFRDYVIGISFLTDEGQEVKAGGRVVKNVAGYDLMKLQVGAVGTLGAITQLTLKVKPKPEAAAVLRMVCSADVLSVVLDRLHATRTRPVIVEIATNRSMPGAAWGVSVAFEEKRETVEWQIQTLLDELQSAPVTDVSVDRSASGLALPSPTSQFSLKAVVPPSRLPQLANQAAASDRFLIHSEALNGILHAQSAVELTEGEAVEYAGSLARVASELGGNVTVRRCPTAWKHRLSIWGTPGSDHGLMTHIKRTLDPKNLFNPGRLLADA